MRRPLSPAWVGVASPIVTVLLGALVLAWLGHPLGASTLGVLATLVIFAGGLAVWTTLRVSRRRLRSFASRLEAVLAGKGSLDRLSPSGDPEVDRFSRAYNELAARLTALEGEAIDQERELKATHQALELSQALEAKHQELEQRLRERAVLFEVLRETAETHDLDRVLATLVDRLGSALGATRAAVALRKGDGDSTVRAAWGFGDDVEVIGLPIPPRAPGPFGGEGILLLPDLTRAPSGVLPLPGLDATGSLAVVPIQHRGAFMGLLILTRADSPMSEVEARFVEAIADQAALAIHATQLFERLEALATHDELTGLANRRLLLRRLDRAMGWADRYSHDLSVLALDLDHFKQLNDREGHAAGDAALVSVAEVLRALARSVDTVARTGGEELIVLLPETDARGAEAMAERLRRGIANVSFPGSDAQPAGHLSVSIGVAVRRSGEAADALIRRADTALYQAKERGRNCVVMAEPTL